MRKYTHDNRELAYFTRVVSCTVYRPQLKPPACEWWHIPQVSASSADLSWENCAKSISRILFLARLSFSANWVMKKFLLINKICLNNIIQICNKNAEINLAYKIEIVQTQGKHMRCIKIWMIDDITSHHSSKSLCMLQHNMQIAGNVFAWRLKKRKIQSET